MALRSPFDFARDCLLATSEVGEKHNVVDDCQEWQVGAGQRTATIPLPP
jgi:hypothetical protein